MEARADAEGFRGPLENESDHGEQNGRQAEGDQQLDNVNAEWRECRLPNAECRMLINERQRKCSWRAVARLNGRSPTRFSIGNWQSAIGISYGLLMYPAMCPTGFWFSTKSLLGSKLRQAKTSTRTGKDGSVPLSLKTTP